jgi:hypothetical protein
MGDIADGLISGEFDSLTGEYLGEPVGYPRRWHNGKLRGDHEIHEETPSEKKIRSIRKEIAIMINEEKIPAQEARRLINIKYGKGWRERGLVSNSPNQWTEEELKPFI